MSSSLSTYLSDGLNGVWGSSSSDVFAVGIAGTIIHYPASPTITSVNTDHGEQGETLDVVITGAYFNGTTDVSFGAGINVNSFAVDITTQITAGITISAGATTGERDITVVTPGATDTITGGFTVNPALPTIASVNADHGKQGETLDVVITGAYFNGTTDVSFGAGINVNSFAVDSATQITAGITIAAGATTGERDISVVTPGGTDTITGGFTIEEKGGGLFGCAHKSKAAKMSVVDILIGWGIVGLCWGGGYCLLRKVT